jgi:membrane protein YqaA with SNARE-associated domain
MRWLKKMYSWILQWAKTPYGTIALFILAFIEAVCFPVPPDILLIPLALGCASKSFRYALFCTLGSVSGAFVGYALGYSAWLQPNGEFTSFANFFFQNIPGFTVELYNNIKELFIKWDFWVIFTAGFTPVPYKVFTITAGVFDMNLFMFFLASIISRGARFFLIAWLIWKFGPKIKVFIEKYLNWIALGFTACLIGGILVIRYLF